MDYTVKILFLLLFGFTFFHKVSSRDDGGWFEDPFLDDDIFNPRLQKDYISKSSPIPCDYDDDKIVKTESTCELRVEPMIRKLSEFEFRWFSSWFCYLYFQPALKNSTAAPLRARTCSIKGMSSPCLPINDTNTDGTQTERCYQVDESIDVVVQEVRRTMISDVGVRKWSECSRNAVKCCKNVLVDSVPEKDSCAATWDGWHCWEKTPAGETSTKVCPDIAYSNSGPVCNHYSYKSCPENGTWITKTNYATCSVTSGLILRVQFHIACLSISLILALPAIIILFAYKRLRVRRLALHRNLLIAIMIRNILVIISKSTILMDEFTSNGETIMGRNNWPCKFLATLEKLASNATFTCMLIDGFFLHRMIVAVFKKDLNIMIVHGIGAAVTIIPVIIWIILMVTMNDTLCWIVYKVPNIQWVLDAPRLTMLAINTILLIDILRVLLTKLKRSENAHNLSTAKATLFLMPLFGVQFIITAWRPQTNSCDWEQAYYFFTYIMDGLQGVMVAMLYCYFNKEVHNLIRLTYKKTENIVSTRFRSEVRDRRTTANIMKDRRDTFTTMLDSQSTPRKTFEDISKPEPFENPRIFTTFKPREIKNDLNENDEEHDEISQPHQETTNVVTLLQNPYTSTHDGFINMEFENDIYEGGYDNLRRLSDEQIVKNESIPKPRVPRNYEQSQDHYQNFKILVSNSLKDQNDSHELKDKSKNDFNNNNNKIDIPNDVIYLNRPLNKKDNTVILPDLCNDIYIDSIEKNGIDNENTKQGVSNEAFDNDSNHRYENLRYIPESDHSEEFETLEDIDPHLIFDDVQKQYGEHTYENLNTVETGISADNDVENQRKESDAIYDEVIFDPSKLCPNRSDDDIVFV